MSDVPHEFPQGIPDFAEEHQQDALRKRIDSNAKAITKARRIRWSLRYSIMICGVILAACFYFGINSPIIGGLVCLSFFLILVCAIVLFSMGGFAPGSTRDLLTTKQKQRLDD